jgi:hypothetical protein
MEVRLPTVALRDIARLPLGDTRRRPTIRPRLLTTVVEDRTVEAGPTTAAVAAVRITAAAVAVVRMVAGVVAPTVVDIANRRPTKKRRPSWAAFLSPVASFQFSAKPNTGLV